MCFVIFLIVVFVGLSVMFDFDMLLGVFVVGVIWCIIMVCVL